MNVKKLLTVQVGDYTNDLVDGDSMGQAIDNYKNYKTINYTTILYLKSIFTIHAFTMFFAL